MCIVIDTNTLSMVFSTENARHAEFECVKEWITNGDGLLVYGGKKYKEELSLAPRYMKLIRTLKDSGKAKAILDEVVNKLEAKVQDMTEGTDCDDQHIIAILGASRCPLLCSPDTRSFPFVKDKSLYPKGVPSVKIYTSPRNKKLLKKYDPHKLANAV